MLLLFGQLVVGLARTVHIHRIWPYIYIWLWPTLHMCGAYTVDLAGGKLPYIPPYMTYRHGSGHFCQLLIKHEQLLQAGSGTHSGRKGQVQTWPGRSYHACTWPFALSLLENIPRCWVQVLLADPTPFADVSINNVIGVPGKAPTLCQILTLANTTD